jgi:hypothetical protein
MVVSLTSIGKYVLHNQNENKFNNIEKLYKKELDDQ